MNKPRLLDQYGKEIVWPIEPNMPVKLPEKHLSGPIDKITKEFPDILKHIPVEKK